MITLEEDIKTGFYKKMYLLCGSEAYLRKQYKDKLLQALTKDNDTMNVSKFEGKGVAVGEIIDLSETLPFFADRRVIFLENTGMFSSQGEALAEYLPNLPDTTLFLFVEEEVDKRSKLFKTVKNIGKVVEFETPTPEILKRWILSILKREKKMMTEQTYLQFIEKTGADMSNISMELEKLVCYTMDKDQITTEDVEAVCTPKITNKIFDMVDAIAKKRQEEALSLYYDLLALKEPPMRILFLIARQFNLLLQVKELKEKGIPNTVIAQKTGLRDFVVSKYITLMTKFSKASLRQALEACVNAEEAVKTGKMNDQMSVELIIVEYSQI